MSKKKKASIDLSNNSWGGSANGCSFTPAQTVEVEKIVEKEVGVPGPLVAMAIVVVVILTVFGSALYHHKTTKVSLYEFKRTVVDRSINIDKSIKGDMPVCWNNNDTVDCKPLHELFAPPRRPEYIYRCQDSKLKTWHSCTAQEMLDSNESFTYSTYSFFGVTIDGDKGLSCSDGKKLQTTIQCQ